MKIIDYKNWYRREFFEFYTNAYQIPLFHVYTEVDVTNVYNFAKKNNISFYFALGHVFHHALSGIEEFNIRIIDKKLVIDDCNEVSFICLNKGEKMFKIIDVKYDEDIVKFCKSAKSKLDRQKDFFVPRKDSHVLEYVTCQPWIHCQITNPYDLNADDFITRLSWDKMKIHDDGRRTVNLSFGANHRVIDGLLVATAIENVNDIIKNLV